MTTVSLDTARQYIHQLDLEYIIDAMCADDYALPRWTRDEAEKCCQQYKNFLLLQKMHLPTQLVPTRHIDEFWHNHILHTKQYFSDCDHIFGHYLHHQPASKSDDHKLLITDFLKTKKLYWQAFSEKL